MTENQFNYYYNNLVTQVVKELNLEGRRIRNKADMVNYGNNYQFPRMVLTAALRNLADKSDMLTPLGKADVEKIRKL